MGRSIGLDVHRDFCQVAIADGGRARSAGRVGTEPAQLALFARSLGPDDRVVLEATGNALAIARILEPHVAEVVLAHAKDVRAISHAKVKTDKVDAKVLADLLAADLIPAVWIGDERTRMMRRLVSRRRGLVKRRTQIKNETAAVLHRNLKGRPPASDPFGVKGRAWLAEQELPIDERLTLDACLRQLDFLGDELARVDRIIAEHALDDPDVRRLMTIPGIDVTTASTLAAVIGDVRRFPTSRHLVGYLGLHPTLRQSGNGPAPSRARLQGGLGRRPPRARRGGVVGGQEPRAAARVRAAHRRPARPARRDRRRRAQARRAGLAPAHPRRGLRLRASLARSPQAPRARAAAPAPRAAKPGPKQDPVWGSAAREGAEAPGRRAGRGRLPAADRRLAAPPGPRGARARHRGAHLKGRLSGKQRGRPHCPRRLHFSTSVTRTPPQQSHP